MLESQSPIAAFEALMESMQQDLEEVAAAIRSEIRLEAEEAEREAAISAAMRRDLSDVARELMAHGDTIALDVGQRIFVGPIVAVGTDVVTVEAGSWRVDVNLHALQRMRVLKRARSGGRRGSLGGTASFRARLLELQLSGDAIEAGTVASDEPIIGPVALVGCDHVAVGEEGGPEWFLPLASLAFVRSRDSCCEFGPQAREA
jgi:hypothetical protein